MNGLYQAKDFNKNTIKRFLEESLDGIELKAIITDGYQSYPSIIEALGAIHQQSVFHKMHNLMLKVFKKENKLNRKIKTAKNTIEENKDKIINYKKSKSGKTGRISLKDNKRQKYNHRIKKLTKENKILRHQIKKYKEYMHQLQKYTEQISQIFQQETQEKARKKFQRLLNKTDKLPTEIATSIKNLSHTIEKSIQHIKHPDIPNTNNLIEGYFKITLPRHLKRK